MFMDLSAVVTCKCKCMVHSIDRIINRIILVIAALTTKIWPARINDRNVIGLMLVGETLTKKICSGVLHQFAPTQESITMPARPKHAKTARPGW